MKLLSLLLISVLLASCSSKIYRNPDYSGKIKDKSLAIVDMNAYSDLLSQEVLDSLTHKPGNIILSPPLKGPIQSQSYFSKVNYISITSVDNFELYKVDLPEKKLNLFLPKSGDKIKVDSSDYDYVLFAYIPYDTTNDEEDSYSWLYKIFFNYNQGLTKDNMYTGVDSSVSVMPSSASPHETMDPEFNKTEIETPDGKKEVNLPKPSKQRIDFADKYIINDLTFVIWDNKKGAIVNYGSFDKIWEESYKEEIYETARMILIKSPFYKRLPPR